MCRQQASFCTHMHMNGKRVEKIKKRISQEAAALVKLKGQQRARQKLSQQQTTPHSHTEENSRANERSGMKPFDYKVLYFLGEMRKKGKRDLSLN